MNDTEALIKDALARQAERAPSPGHTLAALRRPARKRKPMFLIAVAAVAVGAVLFSAGVVVGKYQRPSDSAAMMAPPDQVESTPLLFGPAWVPEGFREKFRRTDAQQVQVRLWLVEPYYEGIGSTGSPQASFSMQPMPGDFAEKYNSWEKITVAGGSGYLQIGAGQQAGEAATLAWAPVQSRADAFTVSVRGVPDLRGSAIKMAESVRLSRDILQSPVKLRYGRDRSREATMVGGNGPGDWAGSMAGSFGTEQTRFRVELSTAAPQFPDGRSVRVRGKDGTYIDHLGVLFVLERSRWLVVGAYSENALTEEQVVRIANEVIIEPNPDYSWIAAPAA